MRVLIVKLSSLGDVVHAMPAVQDMRRARPDAAIDWVVEKGFAPLVRRCEGVHEVIDCELRRWRKSPLSRETRHAWRAFRDVLQSQPYDAVIDLQGLTKSALVAHTARLAPGGKRYALANRTEGAGYEAPTRWVADIALRMEPRVPAVERSRRMCAMALGYDLPASEQYGLAARLQTVQAAIELRAEVALVHGTSREDKLWPEAHWVALGRRLIGANLRIGLPHGGDAERERAERIAVQLGPLAQPWPAMDLGALADRMAGCAGVVGVDSGLSHVATALDLPHVQIYNVDTAWRTGPVGLARQRSVFAEPTPTVDAVWAAWQQVKAAA